MFSACQTPDPGFDGDPKGAGHDVLPAWLGLAGRPVAWEREEEEGRRQEEEEGEGKEEAESRRQRGGEKLKPLLPPAGIPGVWH